MSNWSALQVRTLILCFVLNMLDGADVLVVSFVAPVLTEEWQVSDAAFGLVFSSGLAGMTLGALFLAPFADTYGRKKVIVLASVIIGLGMLLSALATSLTMLAVLRVITGLGIGSILASVAALASEYAPDRYRAFAVTTATAGYPAGATLAGLAGSWIIPEFGWQGMFVLIGLASAIIVPVVLVALPESIDFLLARQPRGALAKANRYLAAQRLAEIEALPEGRSASKSPPIAKLFGSSYRLGTILLWGAFFASFFTLYFLTSWIPRLAIAAGYSLATAINGSAVFNLGALVGLFCLGWIAAKFELALLIVGFFILAFLAMLAFGAVHTPVLIFFIGLFAIGFLVQGGFGGLYAVAAKLYPAEFKTTGVGWGIGIGRLGAVAGPAVGGVALSSGHSLFASFLVFAVPMLLAALLTGLIARFCLAAEASDKG
ncbi:MFS transporter [Altererythrobacter sp. B11]|uniref:MFS transporter n=1 Tax=Altererythrobacter sp. B11 TaxID=2060312 RepID=UPI000DC70071|nr:MFS transporter [Altererythrobacter sp. B11]BBC73560.1 MFS transporter [Altererythrobacter sp. B11]